MSTSTPEQAETFDPATRRRLGVAVVAIGLLMVVGLGPWMFGRTHPLVFGFPTWLYVEAALGLLIWGIVAWATRDLLGGGDGD